MPPRRLQLVLSSLLLVAVVAACSFSPSSTSGSTGGSSGQAASTSDCANAYFPNAAGDNWSYSSSGSSLGNYTFTRTVSSADASSFTMDEVYSTGVNASIKWNCQNGNLAALDAGQASLSMASKSFTLNTTSTTAEGYNVPNSFAPGNAWTETVTVTGSITSGSKTRDGQILSNLKCTSAGNDKITVPAGTFDTVKASCTETLEIDALIQATPLPATAPITINVTNWYAKGVGLVQSDRQNSASGAQTIVLTAYKLP